MNVLGVFIAVLVAVASGEYAGRNQPPRRHDRFGTYRHGSGQTIKDVVELFEALTEDKNEVLHDLGSYATILRVNDEKINLIRQRDIPSIVLSNKQQYEFINIFREQLEGLTSEVRGAQDKAAAALTTAAETANITEGLEDQIRSIAAWNAAQTAAIAGINITEAREDLLQHMKATIRNLRRILEGLEVKTNDVDVIVNGRRCEYGSVQVFFEYDKDKIVVPQTFVSKFDVSPSVTVSLTGFADTIDERGEGYKKVKDNYGKNNHDNGRDRDNDRNSDNDRDHDNRKDYGEDELGIRVSAEQITPSGFNVHVTGFSEGRLENRVGSVRWAACQNLNRRAPSMNHHEPMMS